MNPLTLAEPGAYDLAVPRGGDAGGVTSATAKKL
jgi:hypothetical protein